MRLNAVQQLLESIYRVDVGHRVEDFLITDPDLAREYESVRHAHQPREKLLVAEDDDDLRLALYLDREVLERLGSDDPLQSLHSGNLADFLLALEGVSHFLYLIWRVSAERGVSLMELEMQAEVDKFVALLAIWFAQGATTEPTEVRWCLFEAARLDPALDADQRIRYHDASRFAGKYCRALEHRYLRRARRREMIHELRHFYRLGQADKIRLIDSAA